MKYPGVVFIVLSFCLHPAGLIAQTDTSLWNSTAGLSVKPHSSIRSDELARQYQLNQIQWEKAFNFLRNQDLPALKPGRYPIDGDQVFAIITENPTRDLDSAKWESHREYTDLHYVISGEEIIGVSSPERLTVTQPYDAARDIMNYSGQGKMYPALPGTFFIFFPGDAHRPGVSPGGHAKDKKIVIKIRYIRQ